jgi:hypothetical protein
MASISIDYDSKGDVELVLHGQSQEQMASQNLPEKYFQAGPMSFKVKEVRLRVSSHKLISSSRYFKAMLEGSGFREAQELKEHGFVEIDLPGAEDEPKAMMIILGILYGESANVPSEIDLLLLNEIAVLADKYEWHTLAEPWATTWFNSLMDYRGLPDGTAAEALTWLWIAWVFGIEEHFETISGNIIRNATQSFSLTDENIRLPSKILGECNAVDAIDS